MDFDLRLAIRKYKLQANITSQFTVRSQTDATTDVTAAYRRNQELSKETPSYKREKKKRRKGTLEKKRDSFLDPD